MWRGPLSLCLLPATRCLLPRFLGRAFEERSYIFRFDIYERVALIIQSGLLPDNQLTSLL